MHPELISHFNVIKFKPLTEKILAHEFQVTQASSKWFFQYSLLHRPSYFYSCKYLTNWQRDPKYLFFKTITTARTLYYGFVGISCQVQN